VATGSNIRVEGDRWAMEPNGQDRSKKHPLAVGASDVPTSSVTISTAGGEHIVASIPILPVPLSVLRTAYGLTPCQARVALLLGARLTNREIAQVVSASIGTVRKHAEWVFSRLGVRRREDVIYVLTRDIMTAPGDLADTPNHHHQPALDQPGA